MKKRAVAYVRVSTASEAQLHSYDFQEQYWRGVFEGDPETELVGIYADQGISGRSIYKRLRFLEMIQDAHNGKFDVIYTKSVSRFSRNTTELLETVRELRDNGIEVVFEKENIRTFEPTSEIFLTIAATIAENDLQVDAERMRWSIQHRCENGWISIGSGLYGLRMTKDNNLVVVPEEAAVVRFIFDSYVHGDGSVKIARNLNEAGIKTHDNLKWTTKRILHIIRNEKYMGDVIMGKKVQMNGIEYKNKNGEYGPRYYMENTHEAIISKEQWLKANEELKRRGVNNCKTLITHTFSHMIECGQCGTNYSHRVNNSGKKWQTDIWACRKQLREGVLACDCTTIKDTVLKEKFVEAYNEFVKTKPQGDTVIALQEVLAELRQQERELTQLMMQRLLPAPFFEMERSNIKTQIAEVTQNIDKIRGKNISKSDYTTITEFDAEKLNKFLTKVIVTKYTVTFLFYNGAKISKAYNNGQPGNKLGWNKPKEEI